MIPDSSFNSLASRRREQPRPPTHLAREPQPPTKLPPATERTFCYQSDTPLCPVASCVPPQGRLESRRRGREACSKRASWRSWWCLWTPGTSYVEARRAAHLAGRVKWCPNRAGEVASCTSPFFHASWWVAPPCAAASRRCGRCCGVTGGRSDESQSIDWWNALDHTNTCAHVNLEVKFG